MTMFVFFELLDKADSCLLFDIPNIAVSGQPIGQTRQVNAQLMMSTHEGQVRASLCAQL